MKSRTDRTKDKAARATKPAKADKKAEKDAKTEAYAAKKAKVACGNSASGTISGGGVDCNTAGRDTAAGLSAGKVPRHIAIIMDGNGRWAKARHLPRQMGHREGVGTIEVVADAARKQGVEYLSFFAFSTENWRRPKQEVDSLMNLLKTRLPKIAKRMKSMGCHLVFSGDFSVFDNELRDIILSAEVQTRNAAEVLQQTKGSGGNSAAESTTKNETKNGAKNGAASGTANGFVIPTATSSTAAQSGGINSDRKCVINICLNYGGRQEIVNAANRAIAEGKRIDEQQFSRLLYTKDLPDPDLLIRTGGERRISNFLLFQLAYTELYFCDKLWPDFDENDFLLALRDYQMRNRRFGGV